MHWRRFSISSIPLSSVEVFDKWLKDRWEEKEALLKEHNETGRFPSAQDEYMTSEIRLNHWWELGWLYAGGLSLGIGVALLIRSAIAVQ